VVDLGGARSQRLERRIDRSEEEELRVALLHCPGRIHSLLLLDGFSVGSGAWHARTAQASSDSNGRRLFAEFSQAEPRSEVGMKRCCDFHGRDPCRSRSRRIDQPICPCLCGIAELIELRFPEPDLKKKRISRAGTNDTSVF